MNPKAVIITICLLSCLFSGISTGQDSRTWEKLKPRTWTAVNGKSLQASLIGVEGNQVRLSINGKAIPIKLEQLSPTDQAYIETAKKFKFDELLGFDEVTVTSVRPEGITITHSAGIKRIKPEELSVELRNQFGLGELLKAKAEQDAESKKDKVSWKYGNLEWGSTSEMITELMKEKGFKIAKIGSGFLADRSDQISHTKTKDGKFTRTSIQFNGGKVLGFPAGIECQFANDQLCEVILWQSEFDGLRSDINSVLDAKYGNSSSSISPLGTGRTYNWSGGDGNRTRITLSHCNSESVYSMRYGGKVIHTRYSYDSAISKLVDKALEEDEGNALKNKADASDL